MCEGEEGGGVDRQGRYAEQSERKKREGCGVIFKSTRRGGAGVHCVRVHVAVWSNSGGSGREWEGRDKRRKWGMGGGGRDVWCGIGEDRREHEQ